MNPWDGIKTNLTLAEYYFLSHQGNNLQVGNAVKPQCSTFQDLLGIVIT